MNNNEIVVAIWVQNIFLGEHLDYKEDPLQSEPKKRKRSQIGVMRYPCDKCEYAATAPSSLKQHIENKHEGVRYPCDKCEYAATKASHLKLQNGNKHERVR